MYEEAPAGTENLIVSLGEGSIVIEQSSKSLVGEANVIIVVSQENNQPGAPCELWQVSLHAGLKRLFSVGTLHGSDNRAT